MSNRRLTNIRDILFREPNLTSQQIGKRVWQKQKSQFTGRTGKTRLESYITGLRNRMHTVNELVNAVNSSLPAPTSNYHAARPAAYIIPQCLTPATCQEILAEAMQLTTFDSDDPSTLANGTHQRSVVLDSRNTAHASILSALQSTGYYGQVYDASCAGIARHNNIPVDMYIVTFLNLLPSTVPAARKYSDRDRLLAPLPDTRTGMPSHADEPSYCAVIASLTGDHEHSSLYFTPDKDTLVNLPLLQGDLAYIHQECVHGVHYHHRTADRWTLNTFVYPEDTPPDAGHAPRIRLIKPSGHASASQPLNPSRRAIASEIPLPVQCVCCDKPAFFGCHRCKTAYYCSTPCQTADFDAHKAACLAAITATAVARIATTIYDTLSPGIYDML